MEEGIHTEAQLAAAIEAEQWYDSDSDTEGTDSGGGDSNTNDTLNGEADWTEYFWNTGDQLSSDDQPTPIVDVDTILRQLSVLESELDELESQANQQIENEFTEEDGERTEVHPTEQQLSEDAPTRGGVLAEDGGGVSRDGESISAEDVGRVSSEGGSSVSGVTEITPAAVTVTLSERPKYYCIAHELVTSERTYVQSLRLLEKVVHGAVKTSQLTKRHILSEQARKEIFLNIGEIYALNFDLLQELEDRIVNWDSNPMIADVIAKRAPFFKLYSMYSARFDSAQVAYCKWLKSSKRFAELIKLIETGPLCKGLPVSSYMLCPVQRIPRYKLLLEDYLKHLPEGNPDIENTKAALAAIAEAADHMNERISDLENQAKVVQMQRRFVGKENIVAPGRRYIGRGPVFFAPGSKLKQRVFFLFSDILLIAAYTRAGRYKIQHKLPLKKMLVSVVQSPLLKNSFCIAERGQTKPFKFCTKSAEERTKWITELSQAKTKDEDKFVTLSKRSPYASILNDPEAHGSILDVLSDPSFEHNQPSWVRRSLRVAPHAVRRGLPFTSFAVAAAQLSSEAGGGGGVGGVGVEEVDFAQEDVVTEFVSEEEEKGAKVLQPGLDNSLSSYMQHLSGSSWECRWFVLTCRTLVCYKNHTHDTPTGTLPLVGYSVTSPQSEEVEGRKLTFKLCHPEKSTHIFQLLTAYDYDRWLGTLQEMLLPEANWTHV